MVSMVVSIVANGLRQHAGHGKAQLLLSVVGLDVRGRSGWGFFRFENWKVSLFLTSIDSTKL